MGTTLIAGPGRLAPKATLGLIYEHLANVGEDSAWKVALHKDPKHPLTQVLTELVDNTSIDSLGVIGSSSPDLPAEVLAKIDYCNDESPMTALLAMGEEDYLLLAWRDNDLGAEALVKRAGERGVTTLDLTDGLVEIAWEDSGNDLAQSDDEVDEPEVDEPEPEVEDEPEVLEPPKRARRRRTPKPVEEPEPEPEPEVLETPDNVEDLIEEAVEQGTTDDESLKWEINFGRAQMADALDLITDLIAEKVAARLQA